MSNVPTKISYTLKKKPLFLTEQKKFESQPSGTINQAVERDKILQRVKFANSLELDIGPTSPITHCQHMDQHQLQVIHTYPLHR